MQTIEIKPDVMASLIKKADEEGKSITTVLDEMLRSMLANGKATTTLSRTCHNCKNEIDYEININTGYCDFCESVVFID